MAPQHWQQVKEILSEALEREEGEARTTFVAEKCGEDITLRHEVETYLNISDQNFEACAENIRQTFLGKVWSQPIGHRIGAYRIEREIGRGGMGAVFLAARADGEFEKQVAIKLLKRGTDTDEIVRRFRAELQILAQLEHQSIARLLDAGTTEDGLPYFVMEYVAGVPITKFVRNRQLSIRRRLELFLKVCAAVERAHRDRIVHRDLKPTNILVTLDGEPKLLDFGIAKLLEPDDGPDATVTSQQRLTPTCASPEQARGEQVTTASDIYALGALLYELLTDRTPHQFSTARPSSEELARVICEQEPALPSLAAEDGETGRQLQGDLDNIVLCALRKEPQRRYRSVSEFANDIQQYLAAQPIHARPSTTLYRIQRVFARNKSVGAVAAALAFLVVSFIGLVVFNPNGMRSLTRALAPPKEKAAVPISEKSIAVLPFDNFNKEKESSYFVDGVQDNILTDLAKVSDLKVISRTAVTKYRGAAKNARDIGRALGVAYVLEGSVQRSGGRVRVNAQLIDTRSDTQVWAEHYERNVDDLFALQSELAQTIVAQLKGTLSPSEKAAIESRPTQDMEAYDLYLRARGLIYLFGVPNLPEKWKEGADLLDRAIVRDPKFTLAYCLQSEAQIMLYRYFEHTPARLALAREAAAMGLQLAPDAGESHLAQARYYYHGLRDFVRAQSELNLAAPTMSGSAEFLAMSEVTARRFGRWKDSLRYGKKALSLDPRDPAYAGILIESYLALRMFSEAEKLANDWIARLPKESTGSFWAYKSDGALAVGALDKSRAAVEAAPSTVEWKTSMLAMIAFEERKYAEVVRILATIKPGELKEPYDSIIEGRCLRQLGEPEKSRAAFEQARNTIESKLRERPDDARLLSHLALTYAELGQKEEALRNAQRAIALVPISRDAVDGPYYVVVLAEIHVLSGDTETALNELTKVAQLPNGPSYGYLSLDPGWDTLRGDARFEQIVAQAMAPPAID